MYKYIVKKENYYKDSITLMSITNKINNFDGVINSTIGMATEMNIEIIKSIGFSNEEIGKINSNDMIIALVLENEKHLDKILTDIDELLIVKEEVEEKNKIYSNTSQAILENKKINMAVVSVPGDRAYLDVKKCLENNINVMLFSDNMSIEDEYKLKKLAVSKDLLMMGPDCGTSIINGVGLCFANNIKRGNIGIVGASGTGIQEVTVLIDKNGGGISHAIGTGGRDLNEKIGGLMMLQGMKILEKDENTEKIVLISKPPAKIVSEKIINEARKSNKKYIICFINGEKRENIDNIIFTTTLEETSYKALDIDLKSKYDDMIINKLKSKLNKKQKYLRALYCGGTLAAETEMIFSRENEVYSNVSKNKDFKLENPFKSLKNTVIDLGDDIFTKGKPHPMIDPSIRNSRILEEIKDEEMAVLLLDFELGYGANNNPVGLTFETLKKAKEILKQENRDLVIIAYLLGTKIDKQDYTNQLNMLKDLDILVVDSNLEAAFISSKIIKEVNNE